MIRYYVVIIMIFLGCVASYAQKITEDPLLIGAVAAQTEALQEQYKKRNKMLEAVVVAQGSVTAAMATVHEVEDKLLNYLGNASGVMQNAFQLKRIAELVAIDIPKNLSNLASDIPDNLVGTGVTFYLDKTVADTWIDIAALSATVEDLVTSKYDFKDSKDDSHVNLLSAQERYSILNDVLHRLERINNRLWITKYFIRSWGWKQLWRGLDWNGYVNFLVAKKHVDSAISNWKSFVKK